MALTLEIKVVPKAGKVQLKADKNGIIKCYLKSAPEQGKANKELIRYLASLLKIPQTDISIIKGELTRTKVLLFSTLTDKKELYTKLELEKQDSFV